MYNFVDVNEDKCKLEFGWTRFCFELLRNNGDTINSQRS